MLVDLRWGYDRVRSQAQGFQIRFRFSFWWFHGEVLKRLVRPETGCGQMYAGGDGALFPALARVNDRVECLDASLLRASNGEAVLGSHSRPRCLHLIKVSVVAIVASTCLFEMWFKMSCGVSYEPALVALARLLDLLGNGSPFDLGISTEATVEDSWKHRRRNHRVLILNRVEEEIESCKIKRTQEEDVSLWKNSKGHYKRSFSSGETWRATREIHQQCQWHKEVWFKYTTPKYSFILWLAMKGRMTTGDRMRNWNGGANINVSCVLCNEPLETVEHLFFECSYSAEIWETLMKGVLLDKTTVKWEELMRIMRDSSNGKMKQFIIKYVFQTSLYMIWRERNRRRHGEKASTTSLLIKLIDKNLRNKLTLVQRKGDMDIGKGMIYWFSTR
ncbi:uncharacterized protein LOC130511130 [Raphanus sativus]|uniref:Uncharacterized protein LOC130511130 n=1 Tax=Raphanus sativus TaxID=3726 RepID=A0A9W3DJL0_RAPSA|nr:uncharacterized protein LOC130511130 [Raphanus sativus]